MDPTKETIAATKDGAQKKFSQRQLDSIGQGPDGTYDGWTIKAPTPEGIPAPASATADPVIVGESVPAATDADAAVADPLDPATTEAVSKDAADADADKAANDAKIENVTKPAVSRGKK